MNYSKQTQSNPILPAPLFRVSFTLMGSASGGLVRRSLGEGGFKSRPAYLSDSALRGGFAGWGRMCKEVLAKPASSFIIGDMQRELTESQIDRIKAEVERAATKHLNAKGADEALSHYTEDVMAMSNDKMFNSFAELAADVRGYYAILKEVNLAVWDEMRINVISNNAAFFTAKFRYSFTDTENERTDLQGRWTGLFVCSAGEWKIRARNESFEVLNSV